MTPYPGTREPGDEPYQGWNDRLKNPAPPPPPLSQEARALEDIDALDAPFSQKAGTPDYSAGFHYETPPPAQATGALISDALTFRHLPRRGDVAGPEATRDPIFLLQSKTAAHALGVEWVPDEWTTESVWFTREEAEAWATRHAYRFAEGWRVYCLCAEGALAKLLRARRLHPTGDLLP